MARRLSWPPQGGKAPKALGASAGYPLAERSPHHKPFAARVASPKMRRARSVEPCSTHSDFCFLSSRSIRFGGGWLHRRDRPPRWVVLAPSSSLDLGCLPHVYRGFGPTLMATTFTRHAAFCHAASCASGKKIFSLREAAIRTCNQCCGAPRLTRPPQRTKATPERPLSCAQHVPSALLPPAAINATSPLVAPPRAESAQFAPTRRIVDWIP
jgi:hypothetical protein